MSVLIHAQSRSHPWPPYPARLFGALIAALSHAPQVDAAEVAVVDTLAARPSPLIASHDGLWFWWPTTQLSEAALNALRAVTSRAESHPGLGVRLELESTASDRWPGDAPRWVPDPLGPLHLRIPDPHLRLWLEYADTGLIDPCRTLASVLARYRLETSTPVIATHRSQRPWLVGEFVGALPPLDSARPLAAAIRGAVLHHASEPIPSALSGHCPDGTPLNVPHLACVPLPSLSTERDAAFTGFALSLPADAPLEARAALSESVDRWLPGHVQWAHQPFRVERASDATRRAHTRWCGPAYTWITAIPLVLDGAVGRLHAPTAGARDRAWRKAERLVRRSLGRALCAGGSAPLDLDGIRLTLDHRPMIAGTPHVDVLRPACARQRPSILLHARIEFPFAVAGPLIIGRERHLGFGLCVPVC